MNYLQDCTAILNRLATISVRFRPESGVAVQLGRELASAFEHLSLDEKASLVPLVSAVELKLMGLSGFMAEAAINTKNPEYIRAALMLHVLEDFRSDYRENFRYLVSLAYAASELGANFHALIESVMPLASPHAKARLSNFSARDASLNQLASFGIKGEVKSGMFRFSPA